MGVGPIIRQMLGPLERPISEFYRGIFIDLTAFVDQIRRWAPASNILDLGCGEGAVSERLVIGFPGVFLTGIDITPRVGRMFRGDQSRVTFKQQTIQNFAPQHQAVFDLVIVSDIMHHIPWELHREILINAKKVLKPGGYLVIRLGKKCNSYSFSVLFSRSIYYRRSGPL
jgi:2-polyprenyl-6-hydroxyphenyl methylase/3-demethylubiquinone-9 3-methyltransferase